MTLFTPDKKDSEVKKLTNSYKPGYFHSLNSELENKIEKIKKKYDIQRS